jgi:hypothetical protein
VNRQRTEPTEAIGLPIDSVDLVADYFVDLVADLVADYFVDLVIRLQRQSAC